MNRLVRLACIWIGVLLLSACAEGRDTSENEAREWLPGAAPTLKRAIVLLRTCQPRRPSGYNVIWVSGEGGDEVAHCSFGNDSALTQLKNSLEETGAIGVDYWPSGRDTQPVPWAEFILFRTGIATSGSMTSVIYHAEPQPCSEQREGSDGFSVVTKPLTETPCHWFWRHSSN